MIVNNRETNIGDPCFYVDEERKMHDAVVKNIKEKDGNHYADLKVDKDGQHFDVVDVPHNTSPEAHSWNHPRSKEEIKLHYAPDFYGDNHFNEHEDVEIE